MARFSIPRRYRRGFKLLSSLSDAAIDAILSALTTLRLGSDPGPSLLGKSLHGELHCPEQEARDVIEAVQSLYRLLGKQDLPKDEFVRDIVEAAVLDGVVAGTPDHETVFAERLAKLLSIGSLKSDAKEQALRSEDERTFCRAKVITDIRPVFGDDVNEGPESFIVIHHLKVGYHVSPGEHREVIVTLDSGDLETLKMAIERAELKERALSRVFREEDGQ